MTLDYAKHQIDTAFTRNELRGMSFENTFSGATSFLRRRYTKDLTAVDLAVLGVAFDLGVTNRPGARLGPRAIREASSLQAFDAPYGWGFNPFTDFAIADSGDLAFDYAEIATFPSTLRAHIAAMLAADCGIVTLGGDHSISLPILQAHAEKFGPISLIQFDAHTDTWRDDNPDRIDHGTMFYKAVKQGVIDPGRSVQIGIRTDNPDTLGIEIIDARAVHESGPLATARRIREIVGDHPAYISFDIDALDPAFAPGTGTPVWGGLSSGQAAIILREIAGINLVGGDVVEVAPPYDTTGATAIAAAHVTVELICLYFWNRRKTG